MSLLFLNLAETNWFAVTKKKVCYLVVVGIVLTLLITLVIFGFRFFGKTTITKSKNLYLSNSNNVFLILQVSETINQTLSPVFLNWRLGWLSCAFLANSAIGCGNSLAFCCSKENIQGSSQCFIILPRS